MLFMTKKRLEEEKAKAVREVEEKLWLKRRLDRIEEAFYRDLHKLEQKVIELDMKLNPPAYEEAAISEAVTPLKG